MQLCLVIMFFSICFATTLGLQIHRDLQTSFHSNFGFFFSLVQKQRYNNRKHLLTFCITIPTFCTSLFLLCIHNTVYTGAIYYSVTPYSLNTHTHTEIPRSQKLELHSLTASRDSVCRSLEATNSCTKYQTLNQMLYLPNTEQKHEMFRC